jgi:hypothetical protein
VNKTLFPVYLPIISGEVWNMCRERGRSCPKTNEKGMKMWGVGI